MREAQSPGSQEFIQHSNIPDELGNFDESLQKEMVGPLTELSSAKVDSPVRSVLIELQARLSFPELTEGETFNILSQGMQDIDKLDSKTQGGSAEALNLLGALRHIAKQRHKPGEVIRLLELSNRIRSSEEQTQEIKEKFFDARLEFLIYKHCEKINEGKTGLIFKLNPQNIPEGIKRKLEEQGLPLGEKGENGAIKMLKLFTPEQAEHEAKMQQQAFDTLQDAGKLGSPEYAQVPRMWFTRSLKIRNEKTIAKLIKAGLLQKKNALHRNEDRTDPVDVNVMIMDFIPGEDLASYFFRWTLERKGFDKQRLANMDFKELQDLTSVQLGFDKPSPGSDQSHELQVSHGNAKKLFTFLTNSGMQINPRLVEQVKNTLNLQHENQLYHNDLHWRNIMASGAVESQTGGGDNEVSTWIIDFEQADTHQAIGEDDGAVVATLQKFVAETRGREPGHKKNSR